MSSETKPIGVEGWPGKSEASLWQRPSSGWSFGVPHPRVIAPAPPFVSRAPATGAANTPQVETAKAQKTPVPDLRARTIWPIDFGKKSLVPLYEWEGVVEEVTDTGFRARLVPFDNGRPDNTQVEYTDFTFADLSTESDRGLVREGAIFYWTVGRGKNDAGTVSNVSLVRFRRLVPAGPVQKRLAQLEAGELFADLGGDSLN